MQDFEETVRQAAGRDNEVIKALYSMYMQSWQDNERHSDKTVKERDRFMLETAEEVTGGDTELYNRLTGEAMSIALDYEEEGFTAGFKLAAAMLLGRVIALKPPASDMMKDITAPEGI